MHFTIIGGGLAIVRAREKAEKTLSELLPSGALTI